MTKSHKASGLNQLGPKFKSAPPRKLFFFGLSRNQRMRDAYGIWPRSKLPADHPAALLFAKQYVEKLVLRAGSGSQKRRVRKPSMPKLKCLEKPFEDEK